MAKILTVVKTNEEALQRWDDAVPIWSCSMGGMGNRYEMVIQSVTFEILRSMLEHPHPAPWDAEGLSEEVKKTQQIAWKDYSTMIELTPNVREAIVRFDPSREQFGAAMNIASVFAIHGYLKGLEMIPEDRAILVSKAGIFPKESS